MKTIIKLMISNKKIYNINLHIFISDYDWVKNHLKNSAIKDMIRKKSLEIKFLKIRLVFKNRIN